MTRTSKTLVTFIAVALFAVLSGSMFAQSNASASATASARIVAGIAISKTNDLGFGQIVHGSTAGTVTLNPTTDLRTANGGVTLGQNGGAHAAVFAVTGEPNYNYNLSLPSLVYLMLNGNGSLLLLDNFTSTLTSNSGTLDNSGIQSFSVGATANIAALQYTGVYTGSFTAIVTYQ